MMAAAAAAAALREGGEVGRGGERGRGAAARKGLRGKGKAIQQLSLGLQEHDNGCRRARTAYQSRDTAGRIENSMGNR